MGKILTWIFLSIIGYFLAKKLLFKRNNKAIKIYTIVFSLLSFGLAMTSHPITTSKTIYRVKYAKVKNLKSKREENLKLKTQKQALTKTLAELDEKVDQAEVDHAKAEQTQEPNAATDSEKSSTSKQSSNSNSQVYIPATSQTESNHNRRQRKQQRQTNNSGAGSSYGDMNTASTGRIVGNSRSKIYHVPGQAGYRMNSANAVYFNTEQEAINQGYRKAKR